MKVAEAKKLGLKSGSPMEEISEMMDLEKRHSIDVLNWEEYNYRPDVSFAIAYTDDEIFVKYYVKEKYFKAEKTESNQMVCEDSCVEFFVSPENDGLYYNLEFNAIGTCLLGSGHGRDDSKRADPAVISKIRKLTSIGTGPMQEQTGEKSWTLTLAIPLDVFIYHNIRDLKGRTFKANFYKCGDKLTVPHYVTWNPVDTAKPDYHRPEYFGTVKFI